MPEISHSCFHACHSLQINPLRRSGEGSVTPTFLLAISISRSELLRSVPQIGKRESGQRLSWTSNFYETAMLGKVKRKASYPRRTPPRVACQRIVAKCKGGVRLPPRSSDASARRQKKRLMPGCTRSQSAFHLGDEAACLEPCVKKLAWQNRNRQSSDRLK